MIVRSANPVFAKSVRTATTLDKMDNPPHFGNVPPFTHIHYPAVGDVQLFTSALASLCAYLDLAPPRFWGRAEPADPHGYVGRSLLNCLLLAQEFNIVDKECAAF